MLFHHTLEVNPHSQVAHLQLAYVLLNRGGQPELEESLDHYQAVLDDRPHDPRLLVNIGIVLRRLGRPTSAAAYFDQAWHMDASQVQVEYMLADALFAAGDRRGAITAFSDVFRRPASTSSTPKSASAQLLAQSGDTPAAIAHYTSPTSAPTPPPPRPGWSSPISRPPLPKPPPKPAIAGSVHIATRAQPSWAANRLKGMLRMTRVVTGG